VSEPRRSSVRHPDTARPRRSRSQQREPAPPDRDELVQIEGQLIWLAELLGAVVVEDPDLGAMTVRWPGRGPAFNYVAAVRWSERDWQERLAELSNRARTQPSSPAVLVAEGLTEPLDLAARLKELGWLPLVAETAMWTRRAGVVPHLDASMRIEAVTRASAPEYEAVERAIFAVSPLETDERVAALAGTIEAGTQRAYLVRVGKEPVATARLAARDGIAALHGIGVDARWRRRGYGSLVTTVATRAALALGNRLVWLSVAEENTAARELYEGLDYRPAFSWRLMVAPPG
jgi:ribosomal protein S18 acetylase RimI-like enzyme